MKRKLIFALAVVIIISLLSGCSLFTSGDNGDNGGGSTDPIKMTDSFTFNDPTDIEFAKRYVIYADESSAMVSSAADYGMKAMYSVIYADENDAPVYSYDFMVVDTAEHAQAVIDLYATQGSVLSARDEDPCVLYGSTDGDALTGALVAYQSYGMISDTTVSSYVEFYSASIGGTVM